MEENQFTAKESLDLIQSIVDQTKQKYEENGLTILVWGILVFSAAMAQYILFQTGHGDKGGLPWLVTMVPGFIITVIAKAMEGTIKNKSKTSSDRMGFVWLMAGSMAMFTGFLLWDKAGPAFTTMIWAPFCVAGLSTALYLKENLLITMSIIAAVLAFTIVFLPYNYHPLLTAFIAVVLMVVPGLKLNQDFKKRNRV